MTEDLNRVIGHLQDLRMRIALTRALLETTRKMLISLPTESAEDPQENEAKQKTTKNNRARKLQSSRMKNENTIEIKEDSAENKKNKKKNGRNGQYVLNVARA